MAGGAYIVAGATNIFCTPWSAGAHPDLSIGGGGRLPHTAGQRALARQWGFKDDEKLAKLHSEELGWYRTVLEERARSSKGRVSIATLRSAKDEQWVVNLETLEASNPVPGGVFSITLI